MQPTTCGGTALVHTIRRGLLIDDLPEHGPKQVMNAFNIGIVLQLRP